MNLNNLGAIALASAVSMMAVRVVDTLWNEKLGAKFEDLINKHK